MTFNSISFIFLFLPVVLILYGLLKGETKKLIVLLVMSLLFYAWGNPAYLLLLLFSIAFNYLTGLEIGEWRENGCEKRAKAAMIAAVCVNLLLLGYYKYTGFLLSIFHIKVKGPDLPIGISFFTFSVLSYVFDVYQKKTKPQRNILKFAVYVSFFPKISQGPIAEYRDLEDQLTGHPVTREQISNGSRLFLIGLFKKVLIADGLGSAMASVQALPQMASATAWLGMIFYSLQLFFDFAGYSDMAIAISEMLGFKIKKNFNYPYCSESMSDFWRRWHISLGAWFRDYVYIPMGGNRCSKKRQIWNLAVVWFLTGLWHGASWNFILWGLYHGALVLLDKFVVGKAFRKLPLAVRISVTTLLAFFGWIFFFTPTLGDAASWVAQMFGSAGLGFWNQTTTYYLRQNLLLLVLGFAFSGPFLGEKFESATIGSSRLKMGIYLGSYTFLLLLCIADMISNSYSAFLYFKF